MQSTTTFREAGQPAAGRPAVVLLHSSASGSGQWRALIEQLSGQFHVLAPDLQGCGRSAPWHFARPLRLDDELDALAPLFECAGPHIHLVGHSFGGAVALKAALRYRERLASLSLFEPVLFALIRAAAPGGDAWREIQAIAALTTGLIDAGEVEAATRHFVDYWMGEGRFDATPPAKRPALVAGMPAVKGHWQALFDEATPLAAWADLPCPCLLMSGERSRASALAVAALLTQTLPQLRRERLAEAGHMGPVTHAEAVNALIADFLGGAAR